MDQALSLALYMGPIYLMLGLSILLYAKTWSHLFGKWAEDHLSLFTLMLLEGILGVYLLNTYNVFEWNVWLLVTLTGCWLSLESVFYFIIPGNPIKKCLTFCKQMGMVYLMGVVFAVVGAVLTYYSYLV